MNLIKESVVGGVVSIALAFSPNVISAGAAKVKVNTENDEFINNGKIVGSQNIVKGVGNQAVAQRVIQPTLTYSLNYNSRNNQYINNGTIEGKQNVLGGLGNQAVGQDVLQ